MTIYGMKGLSAYACHATALGENDPEISKFIYKVNAYFIFLMITTFCVKKKKSPLLPPKFFVGKSTRSSSGNRLISGNGLI